MKIALLQLSVSRDKSENIRHACEEIRRAAKDGIDLAILGEMFCCPYENSAFRPYGEEKDGETQQALSALAKELGIYIVGGSFPELEGEQVYNTSVVYDREGREIARHRKMHLFDIAVDGGQYFKESDTLSAGNSVTTFDTEFGTMGLAICFDMRFEELCRCMCLRGAKVIFAPSAFNMTTGPAHWELLFRQRAVDNQCFTVACSPARDENGSYVAYGNSLAVDPWGTVLTRCDGEECTQIVELDLTKVDSVRRQLPILSARRTDIYEMREK